MNNLYLLSVLLIVFLLACKDNADTTEKRKEESKIFPIIETQGYETALADLRLDKDSVILKKVRSYTAIQMFEKNKIPKLYFRSYENVNGKLTYCELAGQDTIISEKIFNNSIEKRWHQINRKVNIKTVGNEQAMTRYVIEQEKNKTDSTKYVRNNGSISYIEFPNRGKETYIYLKNSVKVSYTNHTNDTLYQYNILDDGEKVSKRIYTMGTHHQYQYIYNEKKMLSKIIWKENNTKVNATIEFTYDTNGLPLKRIIQSTIPAFGNSVTTYQYNFY